MKKKKVSRPRSRVELWNDLRLAESDVELTHIEHQQLRAKCDRLDSDLAAANKALAAERDDKEAWKLRGEQLEAMLEETSKDLLRMEQVVDVLTHMK